MDMRRLVGRNVRRIRLEKGLTPGGVCRAVRVQPAVPQQPGTRHAQPDSGDAVRARQRARRQPRRTGRAGWRGEGGEADAAGGTEKAERREVARRPLSLNLPVPRHLGIHGDMPTMIFWRELKGYIISGWGPGEQHDGDGGRYLPPARRARTRPPDGTRPSLHRRAANRHGWPHSPGRPRLRAKAAEAR